MARHVEAHFIGGLMGIIPIISAGTRQLEKDVDRMPHGVDAHHHLQSNWKPARNTIIARYKRTKEKPVIILAGHSKGAQKAIFIARDLQPYGLIVHYLAGIDPTAILPTEDAMTVPDNVVFVDEFWSTSGAFNFPLINRTLFPSGRGGGKYVYPKTRDKDSYKIHVVKGGHIPCASAKLTRTRILSKIEEVLP